MAPRKPLVAQTTPQQRDAAVQQAIDEIAREIGENPNAIGTIDPKRWAEYVNQGVSFELEINGWTAETQMQPEDVGLSPRDEDEREAWRKVLRMPSRYYLPEPEIDRVNTVRRKARHTLYGYAFKVLGLWFVSKNRYKALKEEMEAIKKQYHAAWQHIFDNWDRLERETKHEYEAIGRGNFHRLIQAGVSEAFGKPLTDEAHYVSDFVKYAMRKRPNKKQVEASVGFRWTVRYLPLLDLLDEKKAKELEAKYRQATSEMERDVIAQRQDREAVARELTQFARDLQGAMYSTVYESSLAAIEVLQGKSGTVLKKDGGVRVPIQRIRTMLEFVNESLFWPDDRLRTQLRTIAGLLPESSRKASPADKNAMERALAKLAIESRLTLQAIEWPTEVRSGHHVGIPDDVTDLQETSRKPRVGRVVTPAVSAEEIQGLGTVRRRRPAAVA